MPNQNLHRTINFHRESQWSKCFGVWQKLKQECCHLSVTILGMDQGSVGQSRGQDGVLGPKKSLCCLSKGGGAEFLIKPQ